MKHILEVGIYRPGELTSEVTSLDDVNARVNGDKTVFTGHATVKRRFKGRDFSGFYRLTKVYVKEQERWDVVGSRTARLAESRAKAFGLAPERLAEVARSSPPLVDSRLEQMGAGARATSKRVHQMFQRRGKSFVNFLGRNGGGLL